MVNPAVSWSPTSDRVASGGLVDGFRIYDESGLTIADSAPCEAADVSALAWHPSQELILVGGAPGFGFSPWVCLRDVQSGQDVNAWELTDGYAIHDVVWSDAGGRFATLSLCTITVFDTASQSIINTVELDPFYCEYGERLAWRPGSQLIAAIGRIDQDYIVALVSATGNVPAYFDAEATHLAFSPDGSKLALIGRTGTVWIVDANTFEVQYQFGAHGGLTLAIAWSHDGQLLATGGENPRIAVWQLDYAG